VRPRFSSFGVRSRRRSDTARSPAGACCRAVALAVLCQGSDLRVISRLGGKSPRHVWPKAARHPNNGRKAWNAWWRRQAPVRIELGWAPFRIDLSACKPLGAIKHGGPSILDIRTLQRSGRCPPLRGPKLRLANLSKSSRLDSRGTVAGKSPRRAPRLWRSLASRLRPAA
jgi:hypothetical protein